MEAITRREKFMAAVAGEQVTLPSPITREEMFLAKAAGMDVPELEPITRAEMYLAKIYGSGDTGGGSGGGDTGGESGGEEWIGDGNTHIWITLQEGRTSPMLGVCPNGKVTVDWGDGTTPDVLTGTSVSTEKWTPNHEYAKPGDYVITLTVDGSMGFCGSQISGQYAYLLRYLSSGDNRNRLYQCAVRKIEIGSSVTSIGDSAFQTCHALASIAIPDSVTSIGSKAFQTCHALASIVIPGSVTSIGANAFNSCYALASIVILDGVTEIGDSAFNSCHALASIVIPDSVTSIGNYAFQNCYGVRYYDFTQHTAVPTLASTNAFSGISADCEFRIPAALYDKWIAATNWATYASKIVAR